MTRTRSGPPWDSDPIAGAGAVRGIEGPADFSVTTIAESGYLANVTGIVVDADGDVLVTDATANAVIRIAPDGTQSLVGTPGGDLASPAALAIDRDGLLVVAANFSDSSIGDRTHPARERSRGRRIVSGAGLHVAQALCIDASGDVRSPTTYRW
jgi:DNA-binding beta-propeller fold protein YncE